MPLRCDRKEMPLGKQAQYVGSFLILDGSDIPRCCSVAHSVWETASQPCTVNVCSASAGPTGPLLPARLRLSWFSLSSPKDSGRREGRCARMGKGASQPGAHGATEPVAHCALSAAIRVLPGEDWGVPHMSAWQYWSQGALEDRRGLPAPRSW